ncbi:MAG: hypothetical protein PVF33_13190 [Candidatus Latescibacterota bacterium]
MLLVLRRIVTIGLLSFVFSACSTSTGTINTPIGKIQIGMYKDDVQDILGSGTVIDEATSEGTFITQTLSYPAQDGRTYVVYYVNDVVRRWELKDQASTMSQAQ